MAKENIIERVQNAGKKVVASQADLAKTAVVLEGARILGEEVLTLAKKHAPVIARGYLDTPYGKAILMNAALVAVETGFPDLPDNHPYKQVANAAVVVSYQEFIQGFNVQEIIKGLFGSDKMKAAMAKIAPAEEV